MTGPAQVEPLGKALSLLSPAVLLLVALVRAGARVTDVETLRDVDEVEDAESVASAAPGSRFSQAQRVVSTK